MVAVATMTKAQKAATVVLAMGPQAASMVLSHLAEDEVERIAEEVVELDEIAREDVVEVVAELLEEISARRRRLVGGARGLKAAFEGAPELATVIDRVLGVEPPSRFGFLLDHAPTTVAVTLQAEQRQTAALVLAHLPAKFAGKVLEAFPEDQRHDLAMRVATLPAIGGDVITRVEDAMRRRVPEPEVGSTEAVRGGEREIAMVLNSLDRDQSDAIMANIEAQDKPLADRIRDQMFVFEDIILLDDRAVQEVLRTVEPANLALALSGAEEEVSDLVWGNLSERATTALQEEVELLGKPKRGDIEVARLDIVRGIRELVEAGTITIDRGGDDE